VFIPVVVVLLRVWCVAMVGICDVMGRESPVLLICPCYLSGDKVLGCMRVEYFPRSVLDRNSLAVFM